MSLYWETEHRGFRLGFTSAETGNLSLNLGEAGSAQDHRNRLAEYLGHTELKFLSQVHSADVLDASGVPVTESPTADAWISPDGSHPLAIMVADCLPVLFYAETAQHSPLTAAAHAGRPGLLAGVLENTVEQLREYGGESITAWIGPAACGDCYEVPEDMHAELTADRPALASTTSWGTPALNLRAEARAVLETAGADVVDISGCTIEDPTLFSHRASQQQGRPEGRLAGVIAPAAQ
ncbi:laccase domain-containing protein [Nesterenkonia sp. MY13]|uniref:Laccase domain-containing protein n=1 Tax=Nesterenkonia sedimenti TaxID=1463632 RepID=A0A7X8YEI3_9MICC|nr:polyphenol oxidase family protein [Nesterenkonia sedimenti]NLS10252.1 laccase domain-containing protein [Nesterenkonia sedimenti]